MYNYRLHYLADFDDMNCKKYKSNTEVLVGDVLLLDCGFHYYVADMKQQKTGVRLDLSKSAQNEEEALLLARQYEHV